MEISDFLQSVLKKLPPETVIRNFIVSYLQNKGVKIERKNVQVQKNNLIFLDISPIIKARVNPLYTELLTDLQNHLNEKELDIKIKKIL
jgi:hypothetical protein